MSDPIIIALPSKGRLKEQAEAWLTEAGFSVEMEGGARGYRASLKRLPGADVRLLSAGDIASALEAGDVHLGVTGEDLLREKGDRLDDSVMLLKALGFGRATLVVAAPQSWIDVDSMADLADVAHAFLARTGSRLRVATKYMAQTRAFFARHGVADYRIVESLGATEGAPAAGAAEIVVDITTTGATLVANNLKVIGDGEILRSQAQLAASLKAPWKPHHIAVARRLVSAVEAADSARSMSMLRWGVDQADQAAQALAPFRDRLVNAWPDGALAPYAELFDLSAALASAGVGPVAVSRPGYVFDADCPPVQALAARLGL
jgi:ATP phosphoribosyltransferase